MSYSQKLRKSNEIVLKSARNDSKNQYKKDDLNNIK